MKRIYLLFTALGIGIIFQLTLVKGEFYNGGNDYYVKRQDRGRHIELQTPWGHYLSRDNSRRIADRLLSNMASGRRLYCNSRAFWGHRFGWLSRRGGVNIASTGASALSAPIGFRGRQAWYVDNAVSSSGNGTSWANAWKDFNNINWSLIKPGDTLYIGGGATSQTYTQTLNVGASGTLGNPITIRVGQDSGHNGQVIIQDASINLNNRNYITIDGSVGGVQKLEIKDNFNILNKEDGWAIWADNTIGTVVKFCKITNCNNGIYLTYSSNYTVNDNLMRGIRGDAAIRGILSSGSWDANKIFNNDIQLYYNDKTPPGGSGAYAGPDGIQPGDGTSIYNNKLMVVKTAEYTSTQHPDTIQLAGSEIKVYDNEFINIGDSMIDYDAWAGGTIKNIWIYNNLFNQVDNIDPYPEYIRMYSTRDPLNTFTGVKILNNTFVDSRTVNQGNWPTIVMSTALWKGGAGAGSGNEIRNNIFLHTGNLGIDLNLPATIAFSNNIYPRAQSKDPSGIIGTFALPIRQQGRGSLREGCPGDPQAARTAPCQNR